MMMVEPGKVAHGGTYCGNVIATAAANATLEILENEPILETIFARGRQLMDGMHEILTRANIPHTVTGIPSMFGLMVGSDAMPTDYRSYCQNDFSLYEKLAQAVIARGVMTEDDPREPWFMCYSHSAQDIGETLTAFEDAVREVKQQTRQRSQYALAA
jgi:glutamate-1-semialdehyde 2,1-aminomutase